VLGALRFSWRVTSRREERQSTHSRRKKVGVQSQHKEGRGHAVNSRNRGDRSQPNTRGQCSMLSEAAEVEKR
jgi:hypothetical protein